MKGHKTKGHKMSNKSLRKEFSVGYMNNMGYKVKTKPTGMGLDPKGNMFKGSENPKMASTYSEKGNRFSGRLTLSSMSDKLGSTFRKVFLRGANMRPNMRS